MPPSPVNQTPSGKPRQANPVGQTPPGKPRRGTPGGRSRKACRLAPRNPCRCRPFSHQAARRRSGRLHPDESMRTPAPRSTPPGQGQTP
ncbi:conserved hypothetical protein [Rhodospirillum centenum SW]|uniref:Uncharacterized protein n=1 Tax=Rhodospirillum centenum (strain ATCC 51521 / SW) TaxID=414684 RepID=B6IMT8_RHOCS|nr:conserved hypothetical protein [Rhodospirillum centenum SW]